MVVLGEGGEGEAQTGYERPHIVTDSICAGLDPGKKYSLSVYAYCSEVHRHDS